MKQADEQTLQFILLSLHKSKLTGANKARVLWLLTPRPWADPGTQGVHCAPFLVQIFPKRGCPQWSSWGGAGLIPGQGNKKILWTFKVVKRF